MLTDGSRSALRAIGFAPSEASNTIPMERDQTSEAQESALSTQLQSCGSRTPRVVRRQHTSR